MRKTYTYDNNLLLKDAGLVASSAAGQVSSAAKIIDLGNLNTFDYGECSGDVVIDVSAIEIASNDEGYDIGVQLSSSSSFASDIYEVATLKLGASEVIPGDVDSVTGRYVLPFTNNVGNGVTKRYLRIYTTVAGTVATGINYTAYVAMNKI